MSSKIKVDTIENVAGSGNVSLGSGHNLVVPGNITGQGTAAITSNATVGGTLTTTGASTFTGGLKTGGTAGVSSAPIATIISGGNSLEWGHGNSAGYRSTLGALSGGGQPFIAFSAEHGTNSNTYRTRGLKGHIIQTQNTGGLHFKALQTATGDNQTGTETMAIDNIGRISMPNVPRFLARRNQSSWSPNTNAIMVWDTATPGTYNGYNIGSHYNTSNGKFTCPVAGTYYFEATSIVNTIVTNGAWYLRKNGSAIHEQHITQTSNGWTAHHIAYTGEFAANDTMEVYNGSASIGYYGNAWSYFHGRMIG